MNPTVSVIIPAYNAERTIAATIRSCLNQTHPPLEIIVVDDGSSDRTAEIVESFPAPVRFFRKKNGGPASARNFGARLAQGEWLAMLDADDQWFPEKLERQLQYAGSPETGLIHSLVACSKPGMPDLLTFEDLWQYNWIANSSVLIKRAVFQSLGGFDEDPRLISVEDYNLWLRVADAKWKIVACPEILGHYERGIGISSNIERFFKAHVNNIQLIGEKLDLPKAKTEAKLAEVYASFGMAALFERKMRMARTAYKQAARIKPTAANLTRAVVSHLPSAAFDARRRLAENWMGVGLADASPFALARHEETDVEFGGTGPFLLVIIDAEEEFDWKVVPSTSMNVNSVKHQHRAQRIFEKFNVVPTYAVDFSIASQPEGYIPLRDFMVDGKCEIGTHLHPWINPPIEEEMTARNSFPGNLEPQLEFEKLKVLTETIKNNFHRKPILYRAGRYGVGAQTAMTLRSLGYQVDCSILPHFDLTAMGGPDFRRSRTKPYWVDSRRDLLELPVTVGMIGKLSAFSRRIHPWIFNRWQEDLRLPGIFARLNLLNRVRLSPEGVPLDEAKQLTRALLEDDNHRVFVMSYHSPSLQPGNTPYVQSEKDLERFLHWIEEYIGYFLSDLGGKAITPHGLLAMTRPQVTTTILNERRVT